MDNDPGQKPEPPLLWGERRRLPDCRQSETDFIEWKNWFWSFTASNYLDGNVAEVFVDAPREGDLTRPKSGSDLALIVQDGAVGFSIALQYGAPIELLASAVQLGARGEPLTIVGAVLQRLAAQHKK
jgi:hypothetical protein